MRTNQSIFVCFLCSSRTSFGLLEWLCSFSHQCELMIYCSFGVFTQELSYLLVCNHQIWQWFFLHKLSRNNRYVTQLSNLCPRDMIKPGTSIYDMVTVSWMFLRCIDWEPVEHSSILLYLFYASCRCLRRVLEQLQPAHMRRHLPSNSCPEQAVSDIIAPMIT